jgi:hypothetical protein
VDPEDDLTADMSMDERRQYEATSIIYKCESKAIVSAKKDYVGGICGRMDIGFISDCESYGTIYSEGGDYVGGIAGITGSTIHESFTKCSLGGKNYIGGIVGSGITEDATGESSSVRGCYSLADVMGAQQFVGAIAGKEAGSYEGCYFVSDDLAGVNRISYADQAEPISYEDLLEVKNLPKEFEQFTLTFMVEGDVVHATNFEYGESFEDTIYPELSEIAPHMKWDTAELKNLKKDTVVQAVYANYATTIAGEEVRADNRAIFLAEGQFRAGDVLQMVQREIDFAPGEEQNIWDKRNRLDVIEQWSIKVPEDGKLLHTLRYLPEKDSEDITLYVKQEGKWREVKKEQVGSYLLVNIAGTEAEVAVVKSIPLWKNWLITAGLIGLATGWIIWISYKKKDVMKWIAWILAAMILLAAVMLVMIFLNNKLSSGVDAYRLLKAYVEQPEKAMEVCVDAQVGDQHKQMEATIFCTNLEGKSVTCIEQSGATFFYSDGVLFLENGKAYQTSEMSSDYAQLLKDTLYLYENVDIETISEEETKTYRVLVKDESRDRLLHYLLPDYAEEDLELTTLQIDVEEKEEILQQILFYAKGKSVEKERESFSVEAVFVPVNVKSVVVDIPEVVQSAITNENTKAEKIITEDVFRLYAGLKDLYGRNPLGMQILLNADCGPLTVSDNLTFISKVQDDLRINCVQKDDFSVYFTEDKICSEKGYSVTTKKTEVVETSALIELAYKLLMNGTFHCTQVEDMYIYSMALDKVAMKEVAGAIAKESEDMGIQFENGSIQIRIADNQIKNIRFACDGNMDVLITNVAVAFSAELAMENAAKYESFVVPEKVLETLGKGD